MDAHLPPEAAVRLAVIQTVGVDSRDKLDLARDVAAFVLGNQADVADAPAAEPAAVVVRRVGNRSPGQGASEIVAAIERLCSAGSPPTTTEVAAAADMGRWNAIWHLRRLRQAGRVENVGTEHRPRYRVVDMSDAAAEPPVSTTPEPSEAAAFGHDDDGAGTTAEAPEEITTAALIDGLPQTRQQVLQTIIDLMHEGVKVTALAIGDRLGGMDESAVRYHIAALKRDGRLLIGGSPKRPIYSITGAQVRPKPASKAPQTTTADAPAPQATPDHLRVSKPSLDRPAKRTCLGCGRPFQSTGFGNRMCPNCKSRRDAAGMGV